MFNSRGLFMATLTKKIAAGPVVLRFFFWSNTFFSTFRTLL